MTQIIHDKRHTPVMLNEVLAHLNPQAGEVIIDGTFGAGGYTRAILASGASVHAIDRDITAINNGLKLELPFLTLHHNRFSQLDKIISDKVDGVVLDLGVSSMQFDEAERGFSFRFNAPLDMRMGLAEFSAFDLVNSLPEKELADTIYKYGEERASRPIAREIVLARAIKPIETTFDLVAVITKVLWVKHGEIHPATRTFQALRIAVNEELQEIEQALKAAESILKPDGRLVVVSFHSLEDRLVKDFIASRLGKAEGGRHMPQLAAKQASFEPLSRGAVKPTKDECDENPRARSAKLRAARRLI